MLTYFTAAMCVAASVLLAWRLLGRWDDSTPLVRALGALLGASVFLASGAATVAMHEDANSTASQVVLALVLTHASACLVTAMAWESLEIRFTIPKLVTGRT